jgi:DNA-binding XRE family transcriptional regulator
MSKGFCECGCGRKTNVAKKTDRSSGRVKGKHFRYCRGHHFRIPAKKRFWEKVKKSDGCWEWQAHCNQLGYGTFVFRNKPWLAHRVSWVLCRGEIPKGKLVLHHCDNPGCVNPDHLYIGTNQDNTNDKMERGRINPVKGSRHYKAKLSERDVIKIREMYASGDYLQREIAAIFNVTRTAICEITRGASWKHV